MKTTLNSMIVTVIVFFLTAMSSTAGTFTLDGIYNSVNDAYTHEFTFPLILDNGTPVGTTSLKVGIGANADGSTGGPSDLFLYFEMPLDLKDMTWGTGTHDGYNPADNDVTNGKIAMNQNTGSENIEFQWNGEKVKIKLSQRGNGVNDNAGMLGLISNGDDILGHEIKDNEDGGDAVIAAATSLDYIMNNFANNPGELNLWGDFRKNHDVDSGADIGSNSPALVDDINGDDTYVTVDPAFSDWPFHQSWEVQIAGPFETSDLANLLTDEEFFGADFGGNNPSDSNFKLHASPIKAGDKFDVVPGCDPGDCVITEIVPEPTSLALLALGSLTLVRRRR